LTITEKLKEIEDNKDLVSHPLFPEGTKMLSDDWIRLRNKNNPDIFYSCSYEDKNSMPTEYLNAEFEKVETWMIGLSNGFLALEFTIDERCNLLNIIDVIKIKEKYKALEKYQN
jgi:hypothetical protein